ncbi:MAG: hypothetical protein LBH62_00185 [Nitrososphaerota archaeon]|jgi:hypothetical protein|nr:hypothetical protein [Nitrososphaerota archaeon]
MSESLHKKAVSEFGYSNQEFDEILYGLDKDAIEDSTNRMFYNLLSKYRRIFKLAKEHCEEKSNDENMPHLFAITFSDIEIYLNSAQMGRDDRDNVGCVRYMFNNKSESHRYCILPTTAWKLVDHIFEMYPNFEVFINDPQISDFHNCVDKYRDEKTGVCTQTGKINFEKLVRCYFAIGGLQGIIDKALYCEPDGRLKQGLSVINDMVKAGTIEPIERFTLKSKPTGKDIPVKFDKAHYCEALENINEFSLPRDSINNQLWSLNLAIVCNLTKQPILINIHSDRSIPVRLMSNSK